MSSQSEKEPPKSSSPSSPETGPAWYFYVDIVGLLVHAILFGHFLYLSIRYDEPFWETSSWGVGGALFLVFQLLVNSTASWSLVGPRGAYSPTAGNMALAKWMIVGYVCGWHRDLRGHSAMILLGVLWYWVAYALECVYGLRFLSALVFRPYRPWDKNKTKEEVSPV
ncbi:hypothetical protein F4820DRAFT_465319 [Hypoxylon rubiginosum]|uniref:Uncharacterized protein n=1 Tax=Hypoxylon rubiginosum TaxID=110542 RepID=A0ACB9YPF4_9PEZI|nr:hypothetical protein F4820DRAFT_465319 [Hypoxylon rubiginosum]